MRDVLLCGLVFVIVVAPFAYAEQPPGAESPDKAVVYLNDWGDLQPEDVIKRIQLLPRRTYSQMIDLGVANLLGGDFLAAAENLEVAASIATTPHELSGALYIKAIALSYAGALDDALATAQFLVRQDPGNLDVSWLRLAIALHTGNQLAAAVARDHLMTLDPSASGREVMDPVTGTVIVVAMISATVVSAIALTPEVDRAKVVPVVMKDYLRVTGTVARVMAGSWGQQALTP